MIVYLSIGNSDDKLSQDEWARYVEAIQRVLIDYSVSKHGEWFSLPSSRWQNAVWCLEFDSNTKYLDTRERVIRIRKGFRQDSVAWADVPKTEFL